MEPDKHRLQYSYKIDTSLVNPLLVLPPRIGGQDMLFRSLAARNLKRGYNFSLPSGQDVAAVLGVSSQPPLVFGERLLSFKDMPEMPGADASKLDAKTPLWLYVLAEAQACLAKADGTFDMKIEDGVKVADKDLTPAPNSARSAAASCSRSSSASSTMTTAPSPMPAGGPPSSSPMRPPSRCGTCCGISGRSEPARLTTTRETRAWRAAPGLFASESSLRWCGQPGRTGTALAHRRILSFLHLSYLYDLFE